jgi:hypothetical protein
MLRACRFAPLALILACTPSPAARRPEVLLGNPVLDARAALARGDTTLLAIQLDSLSLPGLEGTGLEPAGEAEIRVFSRGSLGLSNDRWLAQRDSLTTYAAAYNRLIFEGRGAVPRPPS